jgi:hypothetical protein
MKRTVVLMLMAGVLLALSLTAYAIAELTVTDMEFQGKPFNPGDDGRVQRVLLKDRDVDHDDVVLTKLTVENLGSAANDEISWVKVDLGIDGRTIALAHSDGFPISLALLSLPPEERTIPDDGSAMLTISVGIGDQIVDGHTIQTQVDLRYSEGGEGAEATATDRYPEVLRKPENLSPALVPSIGGGVLNPGDVLPVMQVQLTDPSDSNFWGLDITQARVTGSGIVRWILGTDSQKVPLSPGQTITLDQPLFVALDEGTGTVTLWASVPLDADLISPVTLQPRLDLVVSEGDNQTSFSFSDPTPDTVVRGGFEALEASVAQGGRILKAPQAALAYSTVTLTDQDRNDAGLRITGLDLRCLGTLCDQVSNVEVEDGQGNLVGYSDALGPIALSNPAGGALRVSDDGTASLHVVFDVASPVPLGGSLLLAHGVSVQEIGPRGPGSDLRFEGTQEVIPEKAIFFGQPTFRLGAQDGAVSVSTDGETLKTVVLSVSYGPDAASVVPQVLPGPFARIVSQDASPDNGQITLTLDVSNPSTDPLVTVQFGLAEAVTTAVDLQIGLDVQKAIDTAGIELPRAIAPRTTSLSLAPPVPAESEAPAESTAQQSTPPAPVPQPAAGPAFVGLTIRPSYRQGDAMRLSFGIADEKGAPVQNASVSISLVRIEDGQPGAVAYVDAIPYNPTDGKYELVYDTSALDPGTYEIYIASTGGPAMRQSTQIEP